jgi:dipeptidyl aminopeptidase/acylaminoacyl peptidase
VFWILRIGLLLLVGGTALGIFLAEVVLRLSHTGSGGSPDAYNLPFQEVEIEASDGVRLRGWWIPGDSREGTVIVCHGYGADKADALPFAQFLNEAGFGVLVMDFRGHGESGGKTGSLGEREGPDLVRAVDRLVEDGQVKDGRLGIYGYSMGGAMAILAAAKDKRIRAVVTDCAYADTEEILVRWFQEAISVPRFPVIWTAIRWAEFRLGCDYSSLSPEEKVSEIAPRPLFIIHGERDSLIPVEHARRLYEGAAEPKELWVVPEAGHVGAFDEAGDRYRERVARFFREAFENEIPGGSGK